MEKASGIVRIDIPRIGDHIGIPYSRRDYSSFEGYTRAVLRQVARVPQHAAECLAAGYGYLRCGAHAEWYCSRCRCNICGLSCACACDGRTCAEYRATPPLIRGKKGNRRIGIELEVKWLASNARSEAIGRYPWISYDGSLCTQVYVGNSAHSVTAFPGELKISTRRDVLHAAADLIRAVLRPGETVTDRECGFHVHVERRNGDSAHDLVHRWMYIQSDLFDCFPSRQGNAFCSRVNTSDSLSYHYSALSKSRNVPTWEIRIHPATTSYMVAYSWASWCTDFVENQLHPDRIGCRYLKARRSAGNVEPLEWIVAAENLVTTKGFRGAIAQIEKGALASWERTVTDRADRLVRVPQDRIDYRNL